jgi:DNA-binding MarR family transcriptional regulator
LSSQVLSAQVTARPDLEAWVRFLRAHSATTRALSARLEEEHGLTLNDYDVLVQLYYAPGNRMRRIDIARTVLLTPSGVTRLLDGLERARWVRKERCVADARVTYAALTETGREKFVEAQGAHLADIEDLFASRFTREERATLSELLGRLPLAPVPAACEGAEAE